MKKYLSLHLFVLTFFGYLLPLHADFAWTPSTTIDPSRLVFDNVSTCFDSLHNREFAAWIDLETDSPFYSIYENGAWTPANPIDPTFTVMGLRNVYLCYDSLNDRVFAVWNDTSGSNNFPFFSIYANGSWSVPSPIALSALVGGDVFVSYNSTSDQVFATWGSNTGVPTYSIFSAGTWSVPAPIAPGGIAVLNVYTCFNSAQNQMIATWSDAGTGNLPTYSIFSGGIWSAPLSIGPGNTDNVFACYNSLTNEIFATWIDITNNDYPTFSIFNGIAWSSPAVIAPVVAESVFTTVFSCYDSLHNQIFAAWPNTTTCDPVYAIFSNGAWNIVGFINIEPPGVLGDVFLLYNFLNDQVFATWGDCITSGAYFSIYENNESLQPPTNLTGRKNSNRFGTQTEWSNQLFWDPPTSGLSPTSYRIYRDNLETLIGIVPATSALEFIDHNRRKTKAYTYFIVSSDINGDQSTPAIITIQ